MRKFILGLIIATSCILSGVSVASAASVNPGLDGTAKVGALFHKVGSSDYCAYLRYKCNHKSGLGEEGEGNCRRYRQECTISYCERLRRACVHKEERGQEGQGNCRRYRYECGGGHEGGHDW